MPIIEGTTASGFERVREAFAQGQAKDPGGAQLVVYHGGQRVVDLWTAERGDGTAPHSADAISIIMSCTKAVTATCVLRLAERGLLDLDAPLAQYWPEFAANGKAGITIAQVLSHTAGLSVFDPADQLGAADMLNWERCTGALAGMAPLWPPGTACGYHALTQGYLLGEVVRRVSGKTVGQMVAQEISGPLGLDLWIGLPTALAPRVTPQFRTAPRYTEAAINALLGALGADLNDRYIRATVAGLTVLEDLIDTMDKAEQYAAEIPAGNGIASARALAKFYAALIGEVDGIRLLSPEMIHRASTPRTDEGLDPPPAMKPFAAIAALRYGLGYSLPNPVRPMLGPGSFGHDGAGGRLAFANPDKGIAVAYVGNSLMNPPPGQSDPRWAPWTRALNEALG